MDIYFGNASDCLLSNTTTQAMHNVDTHTNHTYIITCLHSFNLDPLPSPEDTCTYSLADITMERAMGLTCIAAREGILLSKQ